MNSKRNVTFKIGSEFMCKVSVPHDDETPPVTQASKRKHSDDDEVPVKTLKKVTKRIKEKISGLNEVKDLLKKLSQPKEQPTHITVYTENVSLGNLIYNLDNTLKDEANNSICIVKEKPKKLDINIVDPIVEMHPKFRPPVSEERNKRIAEKNNSISSNTSSLSSSSFSSRNESKLKIKRSESISSTSTITSDHKTFGISEEFYNNKTADISIPGLDLINQSDPVEINEIYLNMAFINPCLGRIDLNFCKKVKSCFKTMVKRDAIHAKYKCMGAMCSYYSSNQDMFLLHLKSHEQERYLDKDYFLNCSYCFWKFTKPQNLIDHLNDVHQFCRFQCSECFYRSVCQMSVYDHQEQFHPNRNAKIIECLDVPLLKESNVDKGRLEVRCSMKAEKLDCCVCFDKFNNYDECMKHLQSHVNGDESQQKMVEVQKHQMVRDKTQFKIGRYVCLFCTPTNQFATDKEKILRTHMQNHPLKLHFTLDTNNNKMINMKPRGDLKEKTIEVRSLVPNEDLVCKIKY